MNYLRRFCATAALLLTLTLPASAGDMGCPVTSQPPQEQTAAGDMDYPITGEMDHPVAATGSDASAVGPWTDVAFALMQSVFSVF